MKLSDFKVLTFDCYGTLIDWESGMVNALTLLTDKLNGKLTRNEILEAHARHEANQQAQTPHKPYRELLAIVYRRLSEEWGVQITWNECVQYGNSVKKWTTFADSADALKYLKQHFKLVILSNVDNESFAESNKKLGIDFDAIYTAEDIGSYKPSDRNFEYMISMLKSNGYEKTDILHTAESMFHDHAPANRHGLKSSWIYRRHGQEGFGATMHPGDMPHYEFRFTSMKEMAEAHKLEIGG
ncbi:MAG TPA: haloacid dehalogenase type II [Anaerolineales bacterium]|nr:haloacid dehalogenase type II [Anaerolineales bacterium]